MPASLSEILAYGFLALLGLLLIWSTKYTRLRDRSDLEEYHKEFYANPKRRMLEDLFDFMIDIPNKADPTTPYVYGAGIIMIVIGAGKLIYIATRPGL